MIIVDSDYVGAGDVTCDRCGGVMYLYFNGGELDRAECACGRVWESRIARMELVRYDDVADHRAANSL